MSTDPDLANARAFIAALIRASVPAEWRIIPTLEEHKKLTVPAVYLEYTRLEVAAELPPGQVRVVMFATVIGTSTDTAKAEDAADEQVIDLVLALDHDGKVTWTAAEKLRLPTGEIGWRLTLSIIASTTP